MNAVIELFMQHTAYAVTAIGAGVVLVVFRLFGWRAALATAMAMLPAVAYRRGADVQRGKDNERYEDAQRRTQGRIWQEEQGARAAGDDAARRVRDELHSADSRDDG